MSCEIEKRLTALEDKVNLLWMWSKTDKKSITELEERVAELEKRTYNLNTPKWNCTRCKVFEAQTREQSTWFCASCGTKFDRW